jgi:hypothetical protein
MHARRGLGGVARSRLQLRTPFAFENFYPLMRPNNLFGLDTATMADTFDSSSRQDFFCISIWTHQPKLWAARSAAKASKKFLNPGYPEVGVESYGFPLSFTCLASQNVPIPCWHTRLGGASPYSQAFQIIVSKPRIYRMGPLNLQPQSLAPGPAADRIQVQEMLQLAGKAKH